MQRLIKIILCCAVVSVALHSAAVRAAQVPPVPENPRRAQTALGFNPKGYCPDLRITDEGDMAVVVFWLPRSGIPSRISIKSSSGSTALDAATINCVAKLRFAAATTLGDGDPIDSWQQIAMRWAIRAAEPVEGAPAKNDARGPAGNVTVHVCVDESGKLEQQPTIVHSSGVASFDQAALKIAASGSAYYRPDTSPSGPPASGCAQLVIRFDIK
jgi:TonB family protein